MLTVAFIDRERREQEVREMEKQHKEREQQQKERERLERERDRQEREKVEREKQERDRLERDQERDRQEKQRAAEQAVHKHFEESLRLAQQKVVFGDFLVDFFYCSFSFQRERTPWGLVLPSPQRGMPSNSIEEERKRADQEHQHQQREQQRQAAERIARDRYYNSLNVCFYLLRDSNCWWFFFCFSRAQISCGSVLLSLWHVFGSILMIFH